LYKTFNTGAVFGWRLTIEKFSHELISIKGQNSAIADALSRLDSAVNNFNKPNEIAYNSHTSDKIANTFTQL